MLPTYDTLGRDVAQTPQETELCLVGTDENLQEAWKLNFWYCLLRRVLDSPPRPKQRLLSKTVSRLTIPLPAYLPRVHRDHNSAVFLSVTTFS